jgi:hypothetical protein
MPNNNNLIPRENKAQVEEVREIDNKYEIPSFEEFMKTYEGEEGVVDNYDLEVDSYGDIRVKGTYYGPGFWDDIKGVVKPVASVALVAASVFPPTAAVAMPVTMFVAGAGGVTMGVGHVADIKELKSVGGDLVDIASGAIEGQGITESPQGVKQGSLNEYARSRK